MTIKPSVGAFPLYISLGVEVIELSNPIMNNHNVAYNENEPPIYCSVFGFPFVVTEIKQGEFQLVLERIYNTYIHIKDGVKVIEFVILVSVSYICIMDIFIKVFPILLLLACLILCMGGFKKSHKRMNDVW